MNSFCCAKVVLAALLLMAAGAVGAAELTPWKGGATPMLVLNEFGGTAHDLTKYRGKVVLVNFWATWCEPCRDEMPSIERLKEKFSGQPFAVLAVNLDEPESRIRAFLEKIPLKFTILLDPGKYAAKAWNARILPASFVIGRDGHVRYSVVGDIDWSSERNVKLIGDLLRVK